MSRAKSRMYAERYYSLTEDEMLEIVFRAQSGDSSAQAKLLEIFSNFLSKYTTMLFHAKYSLSDYDIRQFVALFVKDGNIRIYLKRNRLNHAGHKHVQEVMRGLQYMTNRFGDEDDIHQTVQLTFLQCVERYERRESKSKPGEYVPFSGYIYSYYYFLLSKNVKDLLIDQLGRKTFPLIADDDQNEEEGERTPGFTAPPTPSVEELLHTDIIDEHWVAGDTAQFPFDVLSVQERQLLKWRYVNGEKSSDISERITEHPNTVREHFNRIRQHIREAIEADSD